MVMTRMEQQLQFVLEVDKLKSVSRRTRLVHPHGVESRCETTAEHSWHICLMAVVLAEHANEAIDLLRVLKMLLLHDVVEVDAGDTPAFGESGDKEAREAQAAERLFGLLPEDQRDAFEGLWREFEARVTSEARFAHALDRLLPPFQNAANLGGSWRDFSANRTRVDVRLSPIGDGSTALWDVVRRLLDGAEASGLLSR